MGYARKRNGKIIQSSKENRVRKSRNKGGSDEVSRTVEKYNKLNGVSETFGKTRKYKR